MPKGDGNRGKGERLAWLKAHMAHADNACLVWPFSKNWNGYGNLGVNGKVVYAHRVMCELVNGPPPTPKHVAAHNCNNGHGSCVHPRHVVWKTPSENLLDRRAAGTLTTKRWDKYGTISKRDLKRIEGLKGHLNQREIAEMFGISYQHVSIIQNRRLARQ